MPERPPLIKEESTKARRKQLKFRCKRFARKLRGEDITGNKVVWKQIEQLPKKAKNLVLLYMKAQHFEHLPNGIPFAVIDNRSVHICLGISFSRVSMPIILVSSNLSVRERQEVAQHEYLEWTTHRSGETRLNSDSHRYAIEKGDARVRDRIIAKRNFALNREQAIFRERYLTIMGKNRRKFSETFRKIAESRHNIELFALEGYNFIIKYNRQEGYFDIYMSFGVEVAKRLVVTLTQEPNSYCHLGRFNYP